jgi:hypothetical protein
MLRFRTVLSLISAINALTLIVPKNHLNHRLTYEKGIKFINSSVNDSTRINDYFNLPDEFTFLTNNDESVCKTPSGKIERCPKSLDAIVWKVDNIKRQVRFRDALGDCLTVGKHDRAYDTYEAFTKECEEDNEDQIFILSQDHGDAFSSEINQKNSNFKTDDEKKKYLAKELPFSDKN